MDTKRINTPEEAARLMEQPAPHTHRLVMSAAYGDDDYKTIASKEISIDLPLFELRWSLTQLAGEAVNLGHIVRLYAVSEAMVSKMPAKVKAVLINLNTEEVEREHISSTTELVEKYGIAGCVLRGRNMNMEAVAAQNGLQSIATCLESAVTDAVKIASKREGHDGQMEA